MLDWELSNVKPTYIPEVNLVGHMLHINSEILFVNILFRIASMFMGEIRLSFFPSGNVCCPILTSLDSKLKQEIVFLQNFCA